MSSRILAPGDPAYPSALAAALSGRELPSLYVRGSMPARPGVAVVGTRQASGAACAFTRELVRGLLAEGFAIWSGGALGIDAAAHLAALEAGGTTVVVSGGGLDRLYPREHLGLFARVLASGGALVARVPDDLPPSPPRFLQRNEVLAALTVATVVVEAGVTSGARSTAAAARRFGRPLCVVPHAPWEPHGAGCALELSRGATAVTSAADILTALDPASPPRARARARARAHVRVRVRPPAHPTPEPPEPHPSLPFVAPSAPPPIQDLNPLESVALSALTPGAPPRHLDEVCGEGNLASGEAATALLMLTLRGLVVEGPAGFYRRPGSSSAGR